VSQFYWGICRFDACNVALLSVCNDFFEEEWCDSFVVFCLIEFGSGLNDIVLFLEVLLQLCAALSNVGLGFFEFLLL
jgi:hypothetical protein